MAYPCPGKLAVGLEGAVHEAPTQADWGVLLLRLSLQCLHALGTEGDNRSATHDSCDDGVVQAG